MCRDCQLRHGLFPRDVVLLRRGEYSLHKYGLSSSSRVSQTVPKRKESNQILYAQSTEHHRPLDGPQMAPLSPSRSRDDPLPLRDLLTFPVLISISNYVALAFLNIAFSALFPLFLAMPIEIGGLDLPPATIGYIMGAYGAGTGLFQFFFFAKIIRRLGERQIFINGMIAFAPLFALFPIINIIARQSGLSIVVWSGIAIICVLATVMDMSYGMYAFVHHSGAD